MVNNFEIGLQEAIAGFQISMIVGLVKIALTLVVAGIALTKSCNAYGTSSKVMTWSIAVLAAMVVWMI